VTIMSVLKLMVTKRMLKIIPLFMTAGLCLAGNAGVFVPLLEATMDVTPHSEDWSPQIKS